jgi:hypothetical protein
MFRKIRIWDRRGRAGSRRASDINPSAAVHVQPDTGERRRIGEKNYKKDHQNRPGRVAASDRRDSTGRQAGAHDSTTQRRLGDSEPRIEFDDDQISSKWEKHHKDFGLQGPEKVGAKGQKHAAHRQAFADAVRAHVQKPDTVHFRGTMRNGPEDAVNRYVIVSYNPNTNIAVARNPRNDKFITGYKLAPHSQQMLLNYRVLQDGRGETWTWAGNPPPTSRSKSTPPVDPRTKTPAPRSTSSAPPGAESAPGPSTSIAAVHPSAGKSPQPTAPGAPTNRGSTAAAGPERDVEGKSPHIIRPAHSKTTGASTDAAKTKHPGTPSPGPGPVTSPSNSVPAAHRSAEQSSPPTAPGRPTNRKSSAATGHERDMEGKTPQTIRPTQSMTTGASSDAANAKHAGVPAVESMARSSEHPTAGPDSSTGMSGRSFRTTHRDAGEQTRTTNRASGNATNKPVVDPSPRHTRSK